MGALSKRVPARRASTTLDLGSQRLAYQEVAAALRDAIASGELAAGERLESEPELSARYGVGRSTIREALRVLSSENLITTSRGVGGGSYVVHPDPDQVSSYLERSLNMLAVAKVVTVEELLAARELLEVPAARLAAERRTSEHLRDLQGSLPSNLGELNLAHMFEGNLRFHVGILEACGNSLLEVMTRPMFMVLRTRFLRDAAPKRFWKQVADDHRKIFQAIEAHDPERAGEEMRGHLGRLRTTYERIDRAARKS